MPPYQASCISLFLLTFIAVNESETIEIGKMDYSSSRQVTGK
jgi:hypothetical protein